MFQIETSASTLIKNRRALLLVFLALWYAGCDEDHANTMGLVPLYMLFSGPFPLSVLQ